MSDQIPLRHQQQKHDRVFFSSVGSETSAEANQVLRRLRPVSTSTYFPSKMASSPPASSYTSSGSTQSRFTPYEIKFTPTTPPPTSRKPTQKPPRATTAAALVASPSPPAIAEPLPLSSVRLRSAVVEQPSLTDTRGGRVSDPCCHSPVVCVCVCALISPAIPPALPHIRMLRLHPVFCTSSNAPVALLCSTVF